MVTVRAVGLSFAIGLCSGVAVSAEVNQTDNVIQSTPQDTVLNQLRPALPAPSATAKLPELSVAADASRRGFFTSRRDKPWDPHICIGC